MMMETLIIHAQHRNQYYSREQSQNSLGFTEINCRTFEASSGVLQSPPRNAYSFNSNYLLKPPNFCSEPPKAGRSRSIPIPGTSQNSPREISFSDEFVYSELWAGPTYSNSPPPSSLPMPKFSLRQKRSVSLELADEKSDVVVQLMSRSAPTSPAREFRSSAIDFFTYNVTATEDLKRILNLDVADD